MELLDPKAYDDYTGDVNVQHLKSFDLLIVGNPC